MIIDHIRKEIEQYIELKISVHGDDHLSMISLRDSKIKNILEYLITWKNLADSGLDMPDYYKAKTILLLMKTEDADQRYKELSLKAEPSLSYNLYNIKIGIENDLDYKAAEFLLKNIDGAIELSFLNNCIIKNPTEKYFKYILASFKECKTISKWLMDYIILKLQ